MRKEECRFARSMSSAGKPSEDEAGCEETVVWEESRLNSESSKEDNCEEGGEDLRQILLSKSRAAAVGVSTEPGVRTGDLAETAGRRGVSKIYDEVTLRRCGRGRISRSVVFIVDAAGTEACSGT